MEKTIDTQVEEEKSTEEEATIEEMPQQREAPTVGLDKFLDIKKENKELKQSLKELESRVNAGASSAEISDELTALAQEHNIDSAFLAKLTQTIEANAVKRVEESMAPKLKSIDDRERAENFNKAFDQYYNQAMDRLTDYTGLVNKEVIKSLAQNPANAKKTISQLVQETYGNALSGRRTIETTQPGGTKEPESVDFARAKVDQDYFKEVMANPILKKEYNSGIEKRIGI